MRQAETASAATTASAAAGAAAGAADRAGPVVDASAGVTRRREEEEENEEEDEGEGEGHPRRSEVQLLRNVITYHFRNWTESQAKELAALQAKRIPAPEPVIRVSGVPVVPQGAQVVSPNGIQAASGVAFVGGMPAVVAATLNGRPITGTYFVSFPGGAGAGQ
ncbi:hypothetical protein MCOR02_001158 [Pyricularia oryzae]|nr:hypothetical protein MCOR02_001158 [Pyricularia oryzae]